MFSHTIRHTFIRSKCHVSFHFPRKPIVPQNHSFSTHLVARPEPISVKRTIPDIGMNLSPIKSTTEKTLLARVDISQSLQRNLEDKITKQEQLRDQILLDKVRPQKFSSISSSEDIALDYFIPPTVPKNTVKIASSSILGVHDNKLIRVKANPAVVAELRRQRWEDLQQRLNDLGFTPQPVDPHDIASIVPFSLLKTTIIAGIILIWSGIKYTRSTEPKNKEKNVLTVAPNIVPALSITKTAPPSDGSTVDFTHHNDNLLELHSNGTNISHVL